MNANTKVKPEDKPTTGQPGSTQPPPTPGTNPNGNPTGKPGEQPVTPETPPVPPSKSGRKVMQISTMMSSRGSYMVLALCDDNTLWQLEGLHEGTPKWESFPTPPAK